MKYIISILVLISIFSCNRSKTPDYIIPHDDMARIIFDMHLTDGLVSITTVRKQITEKDSLTCYDDIFSNYGYTRADFDTSVFYYSSHINEYDKIYQDVLNRLNEKDTELKKESSVEKENPVKEKDSEEQKIELD